MAAAAGGGGNGDVNRDAVKNVSNTELRKIFQDLPEDKPYELELTIDVGPGKKTYNTKLRVLKENIEKNDGTKYVKFTINSKCINVTYDKFFKTSNISKNLPEKQCFTPTLISERPEVPDRITTTDVLQVLKTKLQLAYRPEDTPMLADLARINDILISQYNLLRGKGPIYIKYGYMSPKLPQIIKAIQNTTWGDVANVHIGHESDGPTFKQVYDDVMQYRQKIKLDSHTPIQEVVQNMPFISEIDTVHRYGFNFSEELLRKILQMNNIRFFHSYVLDPTSAAWKHWSNRIKITNASLTPIEENTVNQVGGRKRKRHLVRKTRGKRKSYSLIQTRRRGMK